MSANDDPKLLDLAARISDGLEIGRDEFDALAVPDQFVQRLRIVSRIALAQRSIYRESADEHSDSTTVLPVDRAPDEWRHLRILERLGQGGFGDVYRAHDPQLGIDVALKLLRPVTVLGEGEREVHARILHEARLLARVKHPHVVTIHGVDQEGDRAGLWMDLVEGRSLAACVKEQGPYGAREATSIGIDLCSALAAVHGVGLIHSDVKTSNVMRETGGRHVLMDFGAGLDSTGRDGPTRLVSGTPLYMAPEVICGGQFDHRADIYSLGVLLYHLVSDRYPIQARNLDEARRAHEEGALHPLRDARPDLPDAFLRVIDRALAPDPAARYQSAGEMGRALADAGGLLVQPPAIRTSRRRWLLAAGAVLLAIAVGLMVWPDGAPSPSPYEIRAGLYRGGAAADRLAEGDAVALGDSLTLRVRVSEDVHLYVINEDAKGEAYLLFPMVGAELQNPLRAGEEHVLPGRQSGKQLYWRISSAGVTERFLLVASREALPDFYDEASSLDVPQHASGPTFMKLSSRQRLSLRGVGEVVEGSSARTDSRTGQLFKMARRLASDSESVDGVWVREMTLMNRGH